MIGVYKKFVKKMNKNPERFVSIIISGNSVTVSCGNHERLPILNGNIYISSDNRFDHWQVKKGQVTAKPKDLGIIIKDAETAIVGAGDVNNPTSYLYYDCEESMKDDTQVLGVLETPESVLGFLCDRESGEIMCFNMPLMNAGNLNSYNFFEELVDVTINSKKSSKKNNEISEDGALLRELSEMGLTGW